MFQTHHIMIMLQHNNNSFHCFMRSQLCLPLNAVTPNESESACDKSEVLDLPIANNLFIRYFLIFLFFSARLPFRALAASTCSRVGNWVSWSKANPPTVKTLVIHNNAGCPRSPALKIAKTAKMELMAYTIPSPIIYIYQHDEKEIIRYPRRK